MIINIKDKSKSINHLTNKPELFIARSVVVCRLLFCLPNHFCAIIDARLKKSVSPSKVFIKTLSTGTPAPISLASNPICRSSCPHFINPVAPKFWATLCVIHKKVDYEKKIFLLGNPTRKHSASCGVSTASNCRPNLQQISIASFIVFF